MICGFSSSCEAAGQQLYAGDHEPGFAASDSSFEVFGQSSIASEPSEGSLDHPTFGLGLECADALGACDDLDRPATGVGKCIQQFLAAVDAIGKDVTQLGEHSTERGEQRDGPVVVLDVGWKDLHRQWRAGGVGHQMALASLQPLGRVKPTWAATFRSFNALAVDHASGRKQVASGHLADALDEREVDPLPDALIAPEVKIVLNGRARRKVLGQRAPLATG